MDTIVRATPLDDHRIEILTSSGVSGVFDVKPYLEGHAFKELARAPGDRAAPGAVAGGVPDRGRVQPDMFDDAVRDLLDPRLRGRLGRYGAGRE